MRQPGWALTLTASTQNTMCIHLITHALMVSTCMDTDMDMDTDTIDIMVTWETTLVLSSTKTRRASTAKLRIITTGDSTGTFVKKKGDRARD